MKLLKHDSINLEYEKLYAHIRKGRFYIKFWDILIWKWPLLMQNPVWKPPNSGHFQFKISENFILQISLFYVSIWIFILLINRIKLKKFQKLIFCGLNRRNIFPIFRFFHFFVASEQHRKIDFEVVKTMGTNLQTVFWGTSSWSIWK